MDTDGRITIYKVTTTKAYYGDECGTRYCLRPFSWSAHYDGHDDGGVDYILPKCFKIGLSPFGEQ